MKGYCKFRPYRFGVMQDEEKKKYELYGTSPTNIWSSQLSGQKS